MIVCLTGNSKTIKITKVEKYFDKARQLADVSDFHKSHTGCVAVYQNTIIGIGCNTNKTHPKQKYYNQFRDDYENDKFEPLPKIHAELMCLNSISKLNIDFSKVHLYIYRKRVSKPFGYTRPCGACMKAIKDLGIKHIHYTSDDGYVYEKLIS